MLKSEKKIRDLAAIFKTGSNQVIIDAIEELRIQNSFEGAVALLSSLYDNNEDKLVRSTVELFLNDVKDPEIRQEVINEVNNKELKVTTTNMLIASCWQSGLDYAEYHNDFIDAFYRGDYITGIECLTVLSESVDNIPESERIRIVNYMKSNPLKTSDEKSVLTRELISILENSELNQ